MYSRCQCFTMQDLRSTALRRPTRDPTAPWGLRSAASSGGARTPYVHKQYLHLGVWARKPFRFMSELQTQLEIFTRPDHSAYQCPPLFAMSALLTIEAQKKVAERVLHSSREPVLAYASLTLKWQDSIALKRTCSHVHTTKTEFSVFGPPLSILLS